MLRCIKYEAPAKSSLMHRLSKFDTEPVGSIKAMNDGEYNHLELSFIAVCILSNKRFEVCGTMNHIDSPLVSNFLVFRLTLDEFLRQIRTTRKAMGAHNTCLQIIVDSIKDNRRYLSIEMSNEWGRFEGGVHDRVSSPEVRLFSVPSKSTATAESRLVVDRFSNWDNSW